MSSSRSFSQIFDPVSVYAGPGFIGVADQEMAEM
jgi:hypothetical protein